MEGLGAPAEIVDEIGHMPEADQRHIVRDNTAELTGSRITARTAHR